MKGPPGNWIAPPGSNRSSGGGNKAVGASGVEGRVRRLGESRRTETDKEEHIDSTRGGATLPLNGEERQMARV
jgi:hypothetical protein